MKRREFIKKTGQTMALATLASESLILNVCCHSAQFAKAPRPKPDFKVSADPDLPNLVLAKNTDHAQALEAALDAIGGIGRFIKKGERVLLKPNVAWDRTPEQAVNTNPVVVGAMVKQCLAAGAAEVIVTDYGTHEPERTFRRSGIKEAVEQNGGKLVYTADEDFLIDDLKGKFIHEWPVLKYVFEVDKMINMPIAKHHSFVLGSASMKNFFGAIGGIRDPLHDQIDQAIVDLAGYFKPTLTVVDATRVLQRNGPSGGSLADVTQHDCVICATDQVAADARACEFLGNKATQISHVVLAHEQGLGEIDYLKAGYREI